MWRTSLICLSVTMAELRELFGSCYKQLLASSGFASFSVGPKAMWQGGLVIHMTPKFRFWGTPKTIHKVVRACPEDE